MPLHNHFVPPLSRTHPWRGFHSTWAATLARHLNQGLLPPGYYAIPHVDVDGPVLLDLPRLDLIEVQVFYDENDPQLAAAVEPVNPRNKDRPEARRTFAIKCLSYLHAGSSIIVVDVVTQRQANFHAEILRVLELNGPEAWESPSGLYAVAYRAVGDEPGRRLEAWPEALAVGSPLPRLPLWLGVDICVPLDLETTYQTTCDDLRIRLAG